MGLALPESLRVHLRLCASGVNPHLISGGIVSLRGSVLVKSLVTAATHRPGLFLAACESSRVDNGS